MVAHLVSYCFSQMGQVAEHLFSVIRLTCVLTVIQILTAAAEHESWERRQNCLGRIWQKVQQWPSQGDQAGNCSVAYN